jgi:hypothetical protein
MMQLAITNKIAWELMHMLGPDALVLSGSPAHLACLSQCFLPHFFPLSLPPTSPPPPLPLLPPAPAHPAPSHWHPLFSGAPRSSTNSPCDLLESVQDTTNFPCQIFESVQDATSSQQPVPNFPVSPNATSSPCQIFEPVQCRCRKFSSQSKATARSSDKNRSASYK